MAGQRFLVDNDVRHLVSCFPPVQALQLDEVGLQRDASDDEIVAVASAGGYTIVTNNRRDFEREIPKRISVTSKKRTGCTQVHGLVVVLPSDRFKQERAIQRAFKQLELNGHAIGWKEVNDLCLKVVIEESGKATVTKLPRCPYCKFSDD